MEGEKTTADRTKEQTEHVSVLIHDALFYSIKLPRPDDPDRLVWIWSQKFNKVKDYIKGHDKAGTLAIEQMLLLAWQTMASRADIRKPFGNAYGITRGDARTLGIMVGCRTNVWNQRLADEDDKITFKVMLHASDE